MDYFTSDLHFNHRNIINYCNRPFHSVENMNKLLIMNWNEVVGPDDTVWVLGDICMGKRDESLQLVSQLNGHINLIPGNHDYCHPMHGVRANRWQREYGLAGMDILPPETNIERDGVRYKLCHFPYIGDSQDEERCEDWRPVDDGSILLHGHVHGKHKSNPIHPRQFDVGVDANGYYPRTLEEIING